MDGWERCDNHTSSYNECGVGPISVGVIGSPKARSCLSRIHDNGWVGWDELDELVYTVYILLAQASHDLGRAQFN